MNTLSFIQRYRDLPTEILGGNNIGIDCGTLITQCEGSPMKSLRASLVVTALLASALSSVHAADFPAELFGRYVSQATKCADMQKSYKQTGMWDGITVTKGSVSFIESSCTAARVTKTGEGTYALQLKCSGEGEEWDDKQTYKIAGSELTVSGKGGSERFKRCGS